jgi:hypothetical protein
MQSKKPNWSLEAAKYRGGGYTRIEPSGILFTRSICKLTHVGRKQYAKGCILSPNLDPNPNPDPDPNPEPNPNPNPNTQVMVWHLGIFWRLNSPT